MKKLKVLNLYCGIGGNRKLWENVDVTAVEYDPKIAEIYKSFFPNDTVIVADAHQYLLEHYQDYNNGFIWGSPPCPSHSTVNYFLNAQGVVRYPDMELYQEIILLKHFFKGKYCIENVKSYYNPLIEPQVSGRHYFWANFKIPNLKITTSIGRMCGKKSELGGLSQSELRKRLQKNIGEMTEGDNDIQLGFDTTKINGVNKMKVLNNCVVPQIGLSILNAAMGIIEQNSVENGKLF